MSGWKPFRLMEIPQPEYQRKHNETCAPCRDTWWKSALAIHEATHAAVALDLGLTVEFVSIDQDAEVEATALEAALYAPLLKRGMKIPACVTRLEPRALRNTPKKVLVAMAAPSCVLTGHPQTDTYSAMESLLTVRYAQNHGIDSDEILDWAKREVERTQDHVLELAHRLAEEGRVDLNK